MAKRATKPKEKTKSVGSEYRRYIEWLRDNWKTTIIVGLTVFLVFYMKVAEERSSSLFGKQSDDDLYALLQLGSSATVRDVKKQYNKLVLEYHPDKNPNCALCEEKMGKISKAYEVLSNEDSKMHYDQTNGILEPIKSSTKSLHKLNYQKLVEESPRPWLVQIYSENSSSSQNFAGFWDEFAKEYSYLSFGRINFGSQGQLVRKMPFAVDGLPLVVSLFPGQDAESYSFYGDRSPNAEFKSLIKHSLGHHYRNITDAQFASQMKLGSKKPSLVLIGLDNIPIFFQYVSYYYKNVFETSMTMFTHRSKVQQMLADPKATFVIRPPTYLSTPNRNFHNLQSKDTIASALRYGFFLSIPGRLIRDLQVLFP